MKKHLILQIFLEKTFPLKTLLNEFLELVVQKHYIFIIKMKFELKIFMFH